MTPRRSSARRPNKRPGWGDSSMDQLVEEYLEAERVEFEARHNAETAALRLLAAMMTQQAESHGPGPYGKAYAPEYAVAINHMFYQFIQFLEESPCQPMLYRYASAKTLKALQEGEFIHRCGKGWRINFEWAELMDRTDPTNPGG